MILSVEQSYSGCFCGNAIVSRAVNRGIKHRFFVLYVPHITIRGCCAVRLNGGRWRKCPVENVAGKPHYVVPISSLYNGGVIPRGVSGEVREAIRTNVEDRFVGGVGDNHLGCVRYKVGSWLCHNTGAQT